MLLSFFRASANKSFKIELWESWVHISVLALIPGEGEYWQEVYTIIAELSRRKQEKVSISSTDASGLSLEPYRMRLGVAARGLSINWHRVLKVES